MAILIYLNIIVQLIRNTIACLEGEGEGDGEGEGEGEGGSARVGVGEGVGEREVARLGTLMYHLPCNTYILVQPSRFYRRGFSYLYTIHTIHTKHTTQSYNRRHVRNSMKTWSTPSLLLC